MIPTSHRLKELNPFLDKFSDNEIEDFIQFLNKNGFIWLESKSIFYHDKLQFSIRTMGLDLFINDRNSIENQIAENESIRSKHPDDYDKRTWEIGLWNKIQRSAMLCGFGGLLFGWIIFKWKMWLFYECFCLLSFFLSVRIQGVLLRELDKLK